MERNKAIEVAMVDISKGLIVNTFIADFVWMKYMESPPAPQIWGAQEWI
jgi:hypothetical protein